MGCKIRGIALVACSLWITPTQGFAQNPATLSGKIQNDSVYFTHAERLRHHRYEILVKQSTTLTSQINTVAEGRFRFDATLYPDDFAAQHNADSRVRDDEMLEGEVRQLYLDYLGESIGIKAGIQQIDWIESLSPRTSDTLTAIDLRQGGQGNGQDLIEPVLAVSLNHAFVLGTLEWLVVPLPKHHRLPAGPNGYGYHEHIIAGLAAGRDYTLHREEIPPQVDQAEGGLRWLNQFGSWEFTLIGYRGHQRSPALEIRPVDVSHVEITETFPRVNTFGATIVYGGESIVTRLLGFYEPRRKPSTFTAALDIYERRQRYGIGLDYVYSKHLKFYSEHYVTLTETFSDDDNVVITEKNQETFTNSIRLTNESFDDLLIALGVTLTGREKSRLFTPETTYTWGSYRFTLAGQIVKSDSSKSAFAPLEDTDQVSLAMAKFF